MKRKHRVVVDITFKHNVSESAARQAVALGLGIESFWGWDVQNIAVRNYAKVYNAARAKDMTMYDQLHAEGNRGGSFVEIEKVDEEGMLHVRVGESCVITVNQRISVAALAAILTAARDEGFQKVVDRYLDSPGAWGSPRISVDHDLPPAGGTNEPRKCG